MEIFNTVEVAEILGTSRQVIVNICKRVSISKDDRGRYKITPRDIEVIRPRVHQSIGRPRKGT